MAVRLVTPYRCVRAYVPNLRSIVQHFKKFSSQDEPASYLLDEPDISEVVWPERNLGPLSSKDRRFPLPGNIGVIHEMDISQSPRVSPFAVENPLITLPASPQDRHFGVLARYLTQDPQTKFDMQDFLPEEDVPKAADMLECVAYDCPQILRKDFADLFPGRNTMVGPFTVITLAQHTENDMTMWSEEFMQGAVEICNVLSKNGFWADFIDPVSGKPFKGSHTNTTLFETDERYRKLGFQIEDLGCCKVIRHPIWGTRTFVSSLFTNAPVDHPLVMQLVNPDRDK